MVTRRRWEVECILMANTFAQFMPYAASGTIGFRGNLEGRRTGRIYDVTLEAPVATYPQLPPFVYITPRPESHHWRPDGRGGSQLCVERRWVPSMSTFANTLLVAAKYIAEFD